MHFFTLNIRCWETGMFAPMWRMMSSLLLEGAMTRFVINMYCGTRRAYLC